MEFHNFCLCSSNFSVTISLCSLYLSVSLPVGLQRCFISSHTSQGCSLLKVMGVAVLQHDRALVHATASWAAPLPRGSCRDQVPAGHGDESASPCQGASAPDPCREHLGTLINSLTCSFQAVYRLFSASWIQCCQEHSTCVYQ